MGESLEKLTLFFTHYVSDMSTSCGVVLLHFTYTKRRWASLAGTAFCVEPLCTINQQSLATCLLGHNRVQSLESLALDSADCTVS